MKLSLGEENNWKELCQTACHSLPYSRNGAVWFFSFFMLLHTVCIFSTGNVIYNERAQRRHIWKGLEDLWAKKAKGNI